MTKFEPFSPKQLFVLTWWRDECASSRRDAIICDGAVRSGKTLCMSFSFVAWAFFRFNRHSFALCGKTITSLRRNVVVPLLSVLRETGFVCEDMISKNYIDISFGGLTNRFYLFGGKDEGSASLIQGITLSGVMFDEVALMPRTFVEQALARCSVAGSKFWFNCNPENPYHWFYLEWIKKTRKKNAVYVQFAMKDNPSLSKEMLARYEKLYSGAFYERYIKGAWAAPKGLVYDFFDEKSHTFEEAPICQRYYISCDYGTVNPTSMGLWGVRGDELFRLKEYYYSSREQGEQKTDEEYYNELEKLADGHDIASVIVDPSAASFIECVRRHGKFTVVPAKNDVLYGVQKVSGELKAGRLKIHTSCKDSIREFYSYRWEENAARDTPKKENDHAMDDIRYFVTTWQETEEGGFYAVCAER